MLDDAPSHELAHIAQDFEWSGSVQVSEAGSLGGLSSLEEFFAHDFWTTVIFKLSKNVKKFWLISWPLEQKRRDVWDSNRIYELNLLIPVLTTR